MGRQWTFGQKVGAAFAALVVIAGVIGAVAVLALRSVVDAKDRVIRVDAALLVDAQRLATLRETKGSEGRAFLLTRNEQFVRDMENDRAEFIAVLERLRSAARNEDGRALVDAIRQADNEHQAAIDEVIAMRRTDAPIEDVVRTFEQRVSPPRARVEAAIRAFVTRQEQMLDQATRAATESSSSAIQLMTMLIALAVIAAIAVGIVITRTLGQQIGNAVSQVQSSSAELQAASTQQATSAKEQSTAMSEIATTISELLATSRQITESARRVAQIADETAAAAQAGDSTVDQAQESITAIRRQVDLVVSHMLELGQKSQQIGTVVEIVSELAEQTNILAINATIEAAGAGEAGKRFAVVADEIRKLADRVGGSAKEIRGLIEDVRGAVNTTVMATETGSKAVDAGSKQFAQVTASFKRIVSYVTTTTEAAREIELSIKQQMSAVEQVNVAIANIAQASKETEASTGQTQQTASQLAILSKELLRVIRPAAA